MVLCSFCYLQILNRPVIAFSNLFSCVSCDYRSGWCALYGWCRIPKIGGKPLDLHFLYSEVTSRGGSQQVFFFSLFLLGWLIVPDCLLVCWYGCATEQLWGVFGTLIMVVAKTSVVSHVHFWMWSRHWVVALIAGNQGQKMERAYSCLQFSSYNQQCCICFAQILHGDPSSLWTSLLFWNPGPSGPTSK